MVGIDRSEVRENPWDPLAEERSLGCLELASRKTILASGPPTASTGRTYGCKRSDQTIEKLLRHGGRPHMGPGAEAGTTALVERRRALDL
jgi:hypothetical protein